MKFDFDNITISGRACTGKTTLFWGLQYVLGWSTFSASYFFRNLSATEKLSLEKAEEQNDKTTKIVDYGMRELLRSDKGIICEGWMAGLMAEGIPKTLRILLTCDEEVRVQRFMRRECVTQKEASKRIHDREKNLFKKLHQIYHRNDFVDPKKYNLILDTTAATPEITLREVLRSLRYKVED